MKYDKRTCTKHSYIREIFMKQGYKGMYKFILRLDYIIEAVSFRKTNTSVN